MGTTVDICNRALQKLGAKRITALNEDSKNARSCNLAYYIVLHAELRKHEWNCALSRAQLAASGTDPEFGRAYSFPLPVDFLRLAHPYAEDNVNDLDWQIEGRAIYTDDLGPLNVRYVKKIEAPEMDSLLFEAVATSLALELCEEITQSNTKKAALEESYKNAINEAKKANAIENVAQKPPEDEWVTVRN